MRPLAVLVGILMGTAAAISLGLSMVWVVYLILGSEYAQLRAEREPLLQAVALFIPLTALAALSFVGQVRHAPWRHWPLAGIALWLALLVWVYWPREAAMY
jgi:hypothetical protein